MQVSAKTTAQIAKRVARSLLIAGAAMTVLTACSTTGRSFDSAGLSKIVPGSTTLTQATGFLGATPVDIYRQLDGSLTARWAQKSSMLTDAIYLRQELSLRFDALGHFERVVDRVNVIAEPGKPPVPQSNTSVQNVHAASPAPNPLGDASATSIDNTVVAYPLSPQ